MFKKILIANRGEIARRIIIAAKEMGIATVAIYSNPDSDALHVQEADEAFCLEGIESKETYLDIEKILTICKQAHVDAVHPGYGFLSENTEFAQACEKAKIKFIGPSVKSMKLLASKVASKTLAKKANVPVVPGYEGKLPAGKELEKLATTIGYPLLLKATAGGGGKGMRIVNHPSELHENVKAAEREALAFFKNSTLFIEKYIEHPKHIEVQILGDEHGHLVHLFERECSIQRRHQKMIEEAPSPSLTPVLRKEICEAALRLAKAADYYSAGTAEFLLDSKGNFYFLEVNTRLQVEHPVTEAITGIDLVKAQIRIAAGEKLWFKQDDLGSPRLHAIECRLYAEDPENSFLPSEGKVGLLREPLRPGTRIDSALQEGKEILPYYDPMLAKLIAWGANRKETILKMTQLLQDYTLLGVKHNLNVLSYLLNSKPFQDKTYHTHSVSELLEIYLNQRKNQTEQLKLLFEEIIRKPLKNNENIKKHSQRNPSEILGGFRNV